MAIRIKWDEHETALLIDTFWKIEKDPSAKKQLISKLSSDLRRKAINSGVVIDETYRNENGISMQLVPIAHSFFPDRPTLTTSIMFEKMVQMYKEDKPQFNLILFEARQLVEGGSQMEANMKNPFLDWLSSNSIKKYSENNIVKAIEEASKYCNEHGICKKSIWDIADSKEMVRISSKLLSMRFYRLFHKNEATLLDAVFPYYIKFLKEQEKTAKQVAESVATNDDVLVKGQQEKNESVSQYEPFDRTEAVFLIDTYLKYCDSKSDWKRIASNASNVLRERAQKFDKEIDEHFRSVTSIENRFADIARLLSNPDSDGAHPLFAQLIGLYQTDRFHYAQQSQMVEEQLRKLGVLEELAGDNTDKIIEEKATDTTDNIGTKQADNEQVAISDNKQLTEIDIPDPSLVDGVTIADKLYSTLKTESSKNQYGATLSFLAHEAGLPEKDARSLLSEAEWARFQYGRYYFCETKSNESLACDFDAIGSFAFSKPVSLSYFGETVSEPSSWRQLYIDFLKVLYEDYPSILQNAAGKAIGNSSTPLIASSNEINQIRTPGKFAPALCVELNCSASTIVSNIRKLLDLCNVDYENVEILYQRKEIPSKETDEIAHEKSKEQNVNLYPKEEKVAEPKKANLPKATREDFFTWMLHDQKLAQPTCASYASGISVAEQYAQNHFSSSCCLYGGTAEVIIFTIRSLNQDKSFLALNAQQHNRYLSAIRKYLAYLNMNVDDINDADEDVSSDEQSDSSSQQNEQIVQTMIAHYPYGFKVSSPIELLRFRNGYNADHGTECPFTDSDLVKEINKAGFEFGGKVYVITNETHSKLKNAIHDLVSVGTSIIYYDEFYAENESWLYSERIVSADMMHDVIQKDCYRYQFKPNYFITSAKKCSELEALKNELVRVWGEVVTRNFTELKELLPFVPLEKIKYALSYGEKFTWNSAETYARNDFFHITEGQLDLIRDTALDLCADNGAASFDDLPLEDIMAENFEYSESAVQEIVAMHLVNDFTKNNKVLVRKGEGIDASTAIVNYCKTRESCSMSELEQLMKDTVGDVRYPVVIEAGNSAMVRVSEDNFVADDHLQFDSDTIDALLDEIVEGNGIGMKEVSTFNAFPFCGYAWNLFVLESYCRRFSHKYRYDCITPNSRNAGAIIKKNCNLDFHSIMIESVARSSTKLNEKDVYDYLIEAGFFLRRQYNNMADLLEKAAALREGSE